MAIRIFQHYWHLHLALLAVVEGVIFFFAPFAAAWLRFNSPAVAEQMLGPMLPRGLVFAGVLFISMAAMGLYNSRQRSRLAGLIARVAASVLGGAMCIAILFYVFPALHIGRGALLISLVISFGGSVIARIVFDTLVDEDVFKRRVLVYGGGRRAASIARLRRRSDRRGFTVMGYVPAEGDEASEVPENEKLPTSIYCRCARSTGSTRSSWLWTIVAVAFRWTSCWSVGSKAWKSSSWCRSWSGRPARSAWTSSIPVG